MKRNVVLALVLLYLVNSGKNSTKKAEKTSDKKVKSLDHIKKSKKSNAGLNIPGLSIKGGTYKIVSYLVMSLLQSLEEELTQQKESTQEEQFDREEAIEQLRQAKSLYELDLISENEFQRLKAELVPIITAA